MAAIILLLMGWNLYLHANMATVDDVESLFEELNTYGTNLQNKLNEVVKKNGLK